MRIKKNVFVKNNLGVDNYQTYVKLTSIANNWDHY